jgi:hypothetical protein
MIEHVHGTMCNTKHSIVCKHLCLLWTVAIVHITFHALFSAAFWSGALQGSYSCPMFLFGGGVQNHFRHRWVPCEFLVVVNHSSCQGSSSVIIKFVGCYHNDIWSEW